MRGAARSLLHTPSFFSFTPLLPVCPAAALQQNERWAAEAWARPRLCWLWVSLTDSAPNQSAARQHFRKCKDEYLDLIYMLLTVAMFMSIIQRVVVKFLGKNYDSVCFLAEFCTFTTTTVNRWMRTDVGSRELQKKGWWHLWSFSV